LVLDDRAASCRWPLESRWLRVVEASDDDGDFAVVAGDVD
jgi:hypothetical protein